MVDHTVETILDRWRELERELEGVDEGDRELLEGRIAALREEHRVAMAARSVEADELALSRRWVDHS